MTAAEPKAEGLFEPMMTLIYKVALVIGAVSLVLLAVPVTVDVLLRYVGSYFPGAYEIQELMMGALAVSGMIVIPVLAVIAPAFLLCGIAAPVLGAVKMFDYLLNLRIPFIQNIQIVFYGIIDLNPVAEFFCSAFFGILLFFLGWGAWKLLLLYLKKISSAKKSLS